MKTLTVHGLTQCLKMSAIATKSNIVLDNFSKDNLLSNFYFSNMDDIFTETENMNNIHYGIFSDSKLVEEWLEKDDKINIIQDNLDHSQIHAVSFYDFNQKWLDPSQTKYKIKDDVTKKEYVSFGVSGHCNEMENVFSTKTEKGTVFVFYPTSENIMDLYEEAYKIKNETRLNRPATATLPQFSFEEEMNYELEGTLPFDNNLMIAKATAKNKIAFDKEGAKASSQVDMILVTACMFVPVDIIFEKDFAVAIFDGKNKFPSMVSFVKKEDWLIK